MADTKTEKQARIPKTVSKIDNCLHCGEKLDHENILKPGRAKRYCSLSCRVMRCKRAKKEREASERADTGKGVQALQGH